jgi:hypothetical protein
LTPQTHSVLLKQHRHYRDLHNVNSVVDQKLIQFIFE